MFIKKDLFCQTNIQIFLSSDLYQVRYLKAFWSFSR